VCGTRRRCLKNKTRKDPQLQFYKTLTVAVLAHGAETWTTTERSKRKQEAAEMRVLRSAAGVTVLDQKSTEDIREYLKSFHIILIEISGNNT
jgi:hypothetical protein